MAFHPAGKLLASGSHDFSIRIWLVSASKEKLHLKGHQAPIMSLAYNPDGELLASACMDRTLRLWDPSTGARFARQAPLSFIPSSQHND